MRWGQDQHSKQPYKEDLVLLIQGTNDYGDIVACLSKKIKETTVQIYPRNLGYFQDGKITSIV